MDIHAALISLLQAILPYSLKREIWSNYCTLNEDSETAEQTAQLPRNCAFIDRLAESGQKGNPK
jgi:hypothetical protein